MCPAPGRFELSKDMFRSIFAAILGFETLHFKFCESKLRELTVLYATTIYTPPPINICSVYLNSCIMYTVLCMLYNVHYIPYDIIQYNSYCTACIACIRLEEGEAQEAIVSDQIITYPCIALVEYVIVQDRIGQDRIV